MANELKLNYNRAGILVITADVLQPNGSNREADIALSDVGHTKYYIGNSALIQDGDIVQYYDDTNLIASEIYRESVILAADALDNIPLTQPIGPASDFRELLVQVWMRFFNKLKKDKTTQKVETYNTAGDTVVTEQTYIESTTYDQVGPSS